MVKEESNQKQQQLIIRFHIHLFIILLLISSQNVLSGNFVKYLPGFDGELPFKLETGYISVDDSELFYYFIESERNPDTDPLFLWLTGGPGCSGFSALINEIGPLEYDTENYSRGFPKLRYYPYTRTKVASVIFLDAPVGTGFSYSKTPDGWPSSDTKSSEQTYKFLRKWLIEHPKYLSLQLFIGGDSYAGLTVPLITKKIIKGNNENQEPYMNIKGYLAGCPVTDNINDENSLVGLSHGQSRSRPKGLGCQSAKVSCKENYVVNDSTNTQCIAAVAAFSKCVERLNGKNILEADCDLSLPDGGTNLTQSLVSPSSVSEPWCTIYGLTIGNIWGNYESVREALHVREGTRGPWARCNNSLEYNKDVDSVVHVHKELSQLNLKVLVESGDHDMVIPHLDTLKWIKSLNLSVADDWRPWFVDDQVAGYTTQFVKKHGYHLTFATIKGAGHPAPEYSRKECYELFDRWIHDRSV